MQQLDLLSYQLTPEELVGDGLPQAPRQASAPSPRTIWHETKAGFYLRLMSRFMSGSLCSGVVRRHEIARLHELRQRELAAIGEVK